MIANGQEIGIVRWAPEGDHFSVPRKVPAGPSSAQAVDLFTSDGTLLWTIEGADEAVWLDSSHFIVSSWHRTAAPHGEAWEVVHGLGRPESTSFIGSLASPDLEQLSENLAGGVASGTGALAVAVSNGPDAMFATWTTEAGLGAARPGVPIGWSLSGDKLLLDHPLGDWPGGDQWNEIVGWPNLQHLYGSADLKGPLLMDVGWSRRADWGETTVTIIDLASDQPLESFAATLMGEAVWDANDRVIVGNFDTASAVAYDTSGRLVAEWDEIGQKVAVCADRSTMAWWHFDDGSRHQLNLIRGDTVTRTVMPGPQEQVALSPDGQSIVAVVYYNDAFYVITGRV